VPKTITRLVTAYVCALLVLCCTANAAERPVPLSEQYIRTDFTVEEGLPDNVVNAIAQTGNGLLWVGTQTGLATFDGREFHPLRFAIPGAPSQGAVHSLLVTADGNLWIGSDAGVVLIPKASLDHVSPQSWVYFSMGGRTGEGEILYQARNGVLWAGTGDGLFELRGNAFVNVVPGISINRINEADNGNLLIITGNKFVEFDGRNVIEHPEIARRIGVNQDEIFDAYQDSHGDYWYNTRVGLRRQHGAEISMPEPRKAATASSRRTYDDGQGNLWISNRLGIFRLVANEMQSLNGYRDIYSRAMFQSRDGGLWIGTNGNGLVRFRRRVVRMFTMQDGLASDIVMAVLPTHDGRLWLGGNCSLAVYDGAAFKVYKESDGIRNTCVWSLAEDSHHTVWIGTYGGGLFSFKDGHFTQYMAEQGLPSRIVFQIQVAHDDSLWMATADGVSHMQDGHFHNYGIAQGLSDTRTLSVHEDRAHTIWVETQAGIDRLSGDRFVPYEPVHSSGDPLPARFSEDSLGDLYAVNSTTGASIIEDGRLKGLNTNLNLIGMAESAGHSLWFSSRNGIFRFARDDFRQPASLSNAPLEFSSIDRADGLASTQCSVGYPNIAITPDQKLWVATVKGLAMIDLNKWPGPSRKPEVFLQSLTIEGKEAPVGDDLVLPAGNHRVEFQLAAIDLASPEKILLQYRMDGLDVGWNDADASRTAIYTNIPPGAHTLHIRSTDSNGKWDQLGRAYSLVQQPFFYQTRAFLASFLLVAFVLLSVVYLARVRHLLSRTRTLLEARLLERERIALDLHDTFFQSIQGLFLRFNTGTAKLALDEPARRIFTEALEQSDRVMLEGRKLVLDLHADEPNALDLPQSLARVAEELSQRAKLEYQIIVVGQVRKLHPVCAADLVRIGRESIYNAFQHADASALEVEVLYEKDGLKLRVRDDGRGIDEQVLSDGRRPGHLGLPGMYERSQSMGATINIWSKKGTGTEIEVAVPAAVAYAHTNEYAAPGWFPWRLRRHS
jgi:signal transduction histidine kinase/ligand-binding sensor domain-containing protein